MKEIKEILAYEGESLREALARVGPLKVGDTLRFLYPNHPRYREIYLAENKDKDTEPK